MQELSQSVVLITGVSSGLGAACAQHWLARGGRVVGLDLSSGNDSLPKAGDDRYLHVQGSVTNSEDVSLAVAKAVSHFGRLTGVISCAGILHAERVVGRDGPASLEAFRRVIEVNTIGTFNVVRLAAEAMSKNEPTGPDGERGVIVMTSSIAAQDGQVGQAAYAASKGAVASMTLPIARELAKLGIRVASIAPGVFDTPMMVAASEKVRQPLLDQTPFPKRFGHPNEFAAMVQHLFENPMLNGSFIRLDAALRM
jgi:NAD(P)-dependent dehydrogenase (short-subunit alcohol dehydrogenase family)